MPGKMASGYGGTGRKERRVKVGGGGAQRRAGGPQLQLPAKEAGNDESLPQKQQSPLCLYGFSISVPGSKVLSRNEEK